MVVLVSNHTPRCSICDSPDSPSYPVTYRELYERVCKTIQFIVFVGLALVGSQFNPANEKGKGNNTVSLMPTS